MADINLFNVPAQVASALGIDLFPAQILTALIFMMFWLCITMFMTKGKNPMAAFLVGFASFCFTVAMGWFPVWGFAVLGIAIAVLFGEKLAGKF